MIGLPLCLSAYMCGHGLHLKDRSWQGIVPDPNEVPQKGGRGRAFWTFVGSRVDFPAVAATPPKHFSMIREFHLADVLTLANAACGVAAVFLSMRLHGQPVADPFLRRHGLDAGGPGSSIGSMAVSPAGGTSIRRSGANWIRWPTSSRSESLRRHSDSPPACVEDGTGSR